MTATISISPSPCTQGGNVTICMVSPPELPYELEAEWSDIHGNKWTQAIPLPTGCGNCATIQVPDNAVTLVVSDPNENAPDAHSVVAPG